VHPSRKKREKNHNNLGRKKEFFSIDFILNEKTLISVYFVRFSRCEEITAAGDKIIA
jgi:Uri superfamily endonuclease